MDFAETVDTGAGIIVIFQSLFEIFKVSIPESHARPRRGGEEALLDIHDIVPSGRHILFAVHLIFSGFRLRDMGRGQRHMSCGPGTVPATLGGGTGTIAFEFRIS
jgi:hypothetical protein